MRFDRSNHPINQQPPRSKTWLNLSNYKVKALKLSNYPY